VGASQKKKDRRPLPKEKKPKEKKTKQQPGARHEYLKGAVLDKDASLDEIIPALEQHGAVALPFTPTLEGNIYGPERWSSANTLYKPSFMAAQKEALDRATAALMQGNATQFRQMMPRQKHGLINSYCDMHAMVLQCDPKLKPLLKKIFGVDFEFFPDRYSFKTKEKDNQRDIEKSLHMEGMQGSSYALYLIPRGQWRSVVTAQHKEGLVSTGDWETSILPTDVHRVTHLKFVAQDTDLIVIQQQWKPHGITRAGMLLAPYLGVITSAMAQHLEEKWNALITSLTSYEKPASKGELWFSKQLHPHLTDRRFPWSAVRVICFLYQYAFPYWGSGKENTQHGTDRSSLGYPWVKNRYDNFQPGTCVPVVAWPTDGTVVHADAKYRQALTERGFLIPNCVFESSSVPWRICPMAMENKVGRENMKLFGFEFE